MAVNSPESTATPEVKPEPNNATRLRNFLIAMVAIVLSVTLFLGLRTETTSGILDAQAETSTPLEVALANGKPTLMEFYANWCTSCQLMAPELGEIKEQYADKLNFVMLNVDNSKWLPEITRYRVDGIPHFIFFNNGGEAIAQTLGEQPRSVMQANLDALVADLPLPYTSDRGQISEFKPKVTPTNSTPDDPRTHGSQVR